MDFTTDVFKIGQYLFNTIILQFNRILMPYKDKEQLLSKKRN